LLHQYLIVISLGRAVSVDIPLLARHVVSYVVAPLWLLYHFWGRYFRTTKTELPRREKEREKESNSHLDRISHIRVLAAMACPPLHLPTFQASDAFGPTHLPLKPPAPAIQQHNVRLRREKEREPIPASTATSERTHAGLANAALGTYLIPITPPRPLSLKRVLRMDTQARESAPSHEQAEQWCSWLATLSQWQRRAEER
jgi:hypothetical protein